jgi:hypothetical protein
LLILIRREVVGRPLLVSVDSHVPILELLSVDSILFVGLQIDSVLNLEELTRLLLIMFILIF